MSLHHPDHHPYRHFTTRQRVDKAVQTLEGMADRGSRMADRSPLPAPRSSLSLRTHLYHLRNVSLRKLTRESPLVTSHLPMVVPSHYEPLEVSADSANVRQSGLTTSNRD